MSLLGRESGPGPWAARRARALHLMGRAPHAEEILAFYVGLVEIQETVARRVPVERWLGLVGPLDGEPPVLRLDRLPPDELIAGFDGFLARVAEVGTDVIAEASRTVLGSSPSDRIALLRTALRLEGDEREDGAECAFHARAFLEPIATSLAMADGRGRPVSEPALHARRCFACGGAPGVAVRRDLSDARGSRSLICSLCATEWRFRRLGCPYCGETRADRLLVHAPDSIGYMRVDECSTCERYLKSVDLRRAGDAVPVVDELATVELDLWAQECGLTKLTRNVLGL